MNFRTVHALKLKTLNIINIFAVRFVCHVLTVVSCKMHDDLQGVGSQRRCYCFNLFILCLEPVAFM